MTPLYRLPSRLSLKAEINVVPYIDVMLVLLVIFMVVSPLSPVGTLDLPRAQQANAPPTSYLEFAIQNKAQGKYQIISRQNQNRIELARFNQLADALRALKVELKANPQTAVLIAAEKELRYDEVVTALSAIRQLGATRVGLATQ